MTENLGIRRAAGHKMKEGKRGKKRTADLQDCIDAEYSERVPVRDFE